MCEIRPPTKLSNLTSNRLNEVFLKTARKRTADAPKKNAATILTELRSGSHHGPRFAFVPATFQMLRELRRRFGHRCWSLTSNATQSQTAGCGNSSPSLRNLRAARTNRARRTSRLHRPPPKRRLRVGRFAAVPRLRPSALQRARVRFGRPFLDCAPRIFARLSAV